MPATKHPFDPSRVNYRIVIALVISLLLHLALLSKFGFPSQSRQTHSSTLQVRLNPQLPLTPNKIVTTPATPIPAQPETVVPEKQEIPIQKRIDPAPQIPVSENSVAQSPETPNLEPVQPSPESAAPSKPTAEEPMLPLGATGAPPHWVDIEYEIYTGQDRKLVGKGLHHFESDNNNNYRISFKQIIEPDMPQADVTKSDYAWQLQIQGVVYPYGLRPSIFSIQGALAENLMILSTMKEDISTGQRRLHNGVSHDGILDRQSLLYQFMFLLPADLKQKILLTDGSKTTSFIYSKAGSGTLDTNIADDSQLGHMQTQHIILTSTESIETIDLWLAPDFRYLPLKVRYTDRHGLVTEQLATSVNLK
jgi:hypothetical protein